VSGELEDVLYQDNEASILLENNGRMSCGKGSKRIHIRYFLVTDRINKKEANPCGTLSNKGNDCRLLYQASAGLTVSEVHIDEYKENYNATMKEFGLDENNSSNGASSNPQECVGKIDPGSL